MSTPTFPTLSQDQDSRFFTEKRENPAIRTELEGGYVQTRARHTRTPRRTWTTGFSELTDADRAALNTFWDQVAGGSRAFTWRHPVTLANHTVRFAAEVSFKYTGHFTRYRWEAQITLEEV
jgi:phage-related protein